MMCAVPILNEDIMELPTSIVAVVANVLRKDKHQTEHSNDTLDLAARVFSTLRALTSLVQANLMESDKQSTSTNYNHKHKSKEDDDVSLFCKVILGYEGFPSP